MKAPVVHDRPTVPTVILRLPSSLTAAGFTISEGKVLSPSLEVFPTVEKAMAFYDQTNKHWTAKGKKQLRAMMRLSPPAPPPVVPVPPVTPDDDTVAYG